MHKHTIEYTDFNDQPKTKDVYFNLSEAELTKIQLEYYKQGGVQKVMQDAIDSDDPQQLVDFIDMLVHRAYGVKSENGDEFEKSPELMRKFENSAYYSDLFMMLFQDGGKAGAAFISAVMPKALIEKAEANVRAQGDAQAKLDAQRAAGVNLQPDARTIFEHAQATAAQSSPQTPIAGQLLNAQADPQIQTQNVENRSDPIYQQPAPVQSQQYQPQNQPAYPQVNTPAPASDLIPPATDAGYRLENAEVPTPTPDVTPAPAATPQSYEDYLATQGVISRPPHESGPGFEGGVAGISHDPQQ